MHQYFDKCVGEQNRLVTKHLIISEATPLRYDCENKTFDIEQPFGDRK